MYWPANNTHTLLNPGDNVRLQYRVVVYGGTLDASQLNTLFDQWAAK
jgi:hypothetical protein